MSPELAHLQEAEEDRARTQREEILRRCRTRGEGRAYLQEGVWTIVLMEGVVPMKSAQGRTSVCRQKEKEQDKKDKKRKRKEQVSNVHFKDVMMRIVLKFFVN